MTAVFEEEIKEGIIHVPAHLRDSFKGVVKITVTDDETEKDAEAVDWFQKTLGTLPPFTPMTREEANDRYF